MISQSEQKDKLTSETLDVLRFPMVVVVVFIHYQFYNGTHPSADTTFAQDAYHICYLLFQKILSLPAVPIFFTISGYYFFFRLKDFNLSVYGRKLKSRLHTLLIPYVLWCLIYVFRSLPNLITLASTASDILVSLFRKIIDPHIYYDSYQWNTNIINWFGQMPVHSTSPLSVPLWYVRDLMVLVLLTPVLYFVLKRKALRIVFMSIVAFCLFSGVWPDIHGLNPVGLFYFSAGACFALSHTDLCSAIYPFRRLFYVSYAISLPVYTYLLHVGYAFPYGVREVWTLIAALTYICFAYRLVSQHGVRRNSFLVSSVFFVYVFHFFIIGIPGRIFPFTASHDPLIDISIYFYNVFLTVVSCLVVYYLLSRFMPRLCSVLTGNRRNKR